MANRRRTFLTETTEWNLWPWSFDDFGEWQGYFFDEQKNRGTAYFSTGVFTGLEVTEFSTPNLSVDVAIGKGMHGDGLLANLTAPVNVVIAAADVTDPRIDLVVAVVTEVEDRSRNNPNNGDPAFNTEINETTTIAIVEGTPAPSPVAPAKTANSIVLAEITVAATVVEIFTADIDQTRSDSGGPRELAAFNGQAADINLPRGFIDGFKLTPDAVEGEDLGIGVGQCRDDANTASLEMTTALTKQLDTTWAAGDDAGGAFVGTTFAADTWFYVYAIKKDSDGTVDVGIDDSEDTPVVPTGYTEFRRIGAVKADATPDIKDFNQYPGGHFMWKTPIIDFSDTDSGGDVNVIDNVELNEVPPGIDGLRAFVNIGTDQGSQKGYIWFEKDNPDVDPVLGTSPSLSEGAQGGGFGGSFVEVHLDGGSPQVFRARSDAAGSHFEVATRGYYDHRGQDQ